MTPDKLAPVSEERLREGDVDPYEHITVPWTTIKQIMAAIRARSLTGDT